MDKPNNDWRQDRLGELGQLIVKNSKGDGMHTAAIGALQCIQLPAPNDELPHVYNPCICVIVQGEKQVLLEDEVYRYAPTQFLAVSVDLPLWGQVTVASAEAPYLCLAIDLDTRTIADLLARLDDVRVPRSETARGLFVGDLDDSMLESVVRLARLLDAPQDIPVLAPLALLEFHYRLLRGPYGAAVAQIAIADSNTHKVAQTIRRMRAQYAEPIRVEELASQANMSLSSFHQHFKAVTAMSPLQYQKRLRLTEARGLLLGGGTDAASAAYRVGYQSVSQFSREYARLFGAPPMRDVEALRRA